MKMYLAGSCLIISQASRGYQLLIGAQTHMNGEDRRDKQPREGDTVGDLLHLVTGRAQGGRGDVRAAVVVDYDADGDVDGRDGGLAHEQRARVEARVGHLGLDVEVGRDAAKRKDERGHGRHGAGKVGRVGQLEVGDPDPFLRGGGGPLLDADCDGEDEDCGRVGMSVRSQRGGGRGRPPGGGGFQSQTYSR